MFCNCIWFFNLKILFVKFVWLFFSFDRISNADLTAVTNFVIAMKIAFWFNLTRFVFDNLDVAERNDIKSKNMKSEISDSKKIISISFSLLTSIIILFFRVDFLRWDNVFVHFSFLFCVFLFSICCFSVVFFFVAFSFSWFLCMMIHSSMIWMYDFVSFSSSVISISIWNFRFFINLLIWRDKLMITSWVIHLLNSVIMLFHQIVIILSISYECAFESINCSSLISSSFVRNRGFFLTVLRKRDGERLLSTSWINWLMKTWIEKVVESKLNDIRDCINFFIENKINSEFKKMTYAITSTFWLSDMM